MTTGTIITGIIVFAALGFAVFTLIRRRGKAACGCGCSGCDRCG